MRGTIICEKYLAAPLECLSSPEIAVIPAFYFGTLAIGMVLAKAVRRSGLIPPAKEKTPEYNSDFYLGNHLPSVLMNARIGIFGLLALYDVWASPNFNGPFAAHDYAGVIALDAQLWFTGYLIFECALNVFTRHVTTELMVHHLVFGVISVIVLYRGGLTGMVAALLAQEVSTVPLNMFLMVRGFYGMDAARKWFVLFTVVFIPVRLGFSGVCSAAFIASWYSPGISSQPPWTPAFEAWEALVIVLGVGAGMAMQLFWARVMVKRVIKPLMEGKKVD